MLGLDLALIDVVVCNPLAESYVIAEAESPGTTLERAEIRKNHEHFERADKRDMVFYPLALTIFGQLGRWVERCQPSQPAKHQLTCMF